MFNVCSGHGLSPCHLSTSPHELPSLGLQWEQLNLGKMPTIGKQGGEHAFGRVGPNTRQCCEHLVGCHKGVTPSLHFFVQDSLVGAPQ